jgi:cysteine desulfurase
METSSVKKGRKVSKKKTNKSDKLIKKTKSVPNESKKDNKKKQKNSSKNVQKSTLSKDNSSQCNVIYLDNVVTSALCPNAEKMYKKSISTKNIRPADREKIVNDAKEYLLKTCNSNNNYSMFFTSGEIESNNIFLCSTVNAYKKIRKVTPHIVISAVENTSIIKYANSLKDSGQIELTFLRPNIYGCILSEHIVSALKPNTCCVLITYINQELGAVNNIEKISNILHDKKIPIHSDCTYLFGKHKLDLTKTNIDAATISFDKISGPVGLGAIIVKTDLLEGYKLYEHSTTLENKRTENIPAISSAVESVKFSLNNRQTKNKKLLKMRKEIISKLTSKYQVMLYSDFVNSDTSPLDEGSKAKTKIILLGPPSNNESYYTPSILSLIVINKKNKTGKDIQKELEKKDIIIGVPDLDSVHVYNEIKMPVDIQKNIIRISLADDINPPDIAKFLTAFDKII